MKFPQPGLYMPCRLLEVRDGDTIVVAFSGAYAWPIRLIDCWCPETRGTERPYGLAAKEYCKTILHEEQLSVFIPAPADLVTAIRKGKRTTRSPINVQSILTFDRRPGHVFVGVDRSSLADLMIDAGFAARTKQEAQAKTCQGSWPMFPKKPD